MHLLFPYFLSNDNADTRTKVVIRINKHKLTILSNVRSIFKKYSSLNYIFLILKSYFAVKRKVTVKHLLTVNFFMKEQYNYENKEFLIEIFHSLSRLA